jgi:hypothetical protein
MIIDGTLMLPQQITGNVAAVFCFNVDQGVKVSFVYGKNSIFVFVRLFRFIYILINIC